jgi:penicillin-binding protein 1A
MTDERSDTPPAEGETAEPIPFPNADGEDGGAVDRPRINRVRLALILVPLCMLAIVSTVFGMMMAVASDLPGLENKQQYKHSRRSILLDINGKPLGVLTDPQSRIVDRPNQISFAMQRAIISVEDQRFYENQGIDVKGIARALLADVTRQGATQGASTITQQFVKNAISAQNNRTIFEKLREAALAYHLTRKWPKDKILTEYLNTVYFGNGAYGVESAARVYFASDLANTCGSSPEDACANHLEPAQAALLAGMVASPQAFDPITHPQAARQRRNFVLRRMQQQGYITKPEFDQDINVALPTRNSIRPPSDEVTEPSAAYFTNWARQQVIDYYRYHGGEQRAFTGGLKIKTSLDIDLQRSAVQAVTGRLSDPTGPTASLVAIDNATGEVRAMVGGRDFQKSAFNLATQGQRQPGSAWKAFSLAQAIRSHISPDSVWASQQKEFVVPGSAGKEVFQVHNFEGAYAGSISLRDAIAESDNSVFAEVGIKVGTKNIANVARSMGIRTPISTNPAMTLGGLRQGVTALDMAHAYETLATGGSRVTGTFGEIGTARENGPVGIHEIREPGGVTVRNEVHKIRVLHSEQAKTETEMLQGVIASGTGTSAAIGGFEAGKTGTTENSGDAWFVGYNNKYTVAVWVGYPDKLRPMLTEYNGQSVTGKTFPAEIWHDFMAATRDIDSQRAADKAAQEALKHPDRVATQDTTATDSGAGAASSPSQGSQSGSQSQSQPQSGAPPPSQSPPSSSGGGNQDATPQGPSQAPPSQSGGAAAPGQ